MGKIKVLSREVAGKIAAGEIIEKPLSVVKELIENSLDASATEISILIEDGGKKSIIVKDNGDGIEKEDLKIIFKRHSTSKIETVDDLEKIFTFGFRGEALSSIAEVSKTTIISSTREGETSYGVSFFNGELTFIDDAPYRKGTMVKVENLFYNLPARKNFLRAAKTENLAIKNFIKHFSLVNENIKISFISNEKERLFYEGVGEKKDRFYQIYGKDKIYNDFFEAEFDRGDYSFHGFFVKPGLEEYKRYPQLIFINKRLVKEKTTFQAIYSGYDTYLKKGVKPGFIIFIDIPPDEVEVNIHPTKAEVKLKNSSEFFRILRAALRKELEGFFLGKTNSSPSEGYADTGASFDNLKYKTGNNSNFHGIKRESFFDNHKREGKIDDNFKQNEISAQKLLMEPPTDFKIIGQYLNSYVIIEKRGKLLIIDQHNADERVKYEKLIENRETNSIKRVKPLFPIVFEYKTDETTEEKINKLKKFGWDIEMWGENSLSVKLYPAIMDNRSIRDFIMEYLDSKEKEDVEDSILKLMSCKSAIKVNHPLTKEEMEALVKALFKTKNPYLCPHSRPIIVELSEDFIKKQLKRK
jgi:DNA mismatch repair protein MutL